MGEAPYFTPKLKAVSPLRNRQLRDVLQIDLRRDP